MEISYPPSLSLPLGFLAVGPEQRGKWDFLTKTHHLCRRRRLRERPINVGGGGGDGIKRTDGTDRGDINRRVRVAGESRADPTFAAAAAAKL